MKRTFFSFQKTLLLAQTILLFAAGRLSADAQTNDSPGWEAGYVKNNGEYVTIGNIMVKTDSPLNTVEFKQFKWRDELLMRIRESDPTHGIDRFVEGSWQLAKDYPNRLNGYQNLMSAMEAYHRTGQVAKARALANELAASAAPEDIKRWTEGFLHRLDSACRPVTMNFTAMDGREVDLRQLHGKVVLVDFWATWCGPCKVELPFVKAAYDKFHAQGFEIIGVSCDTDKEKLNQFVKDKDLPWPQYFDGQQQIKNKIAQEFGVDGIPHMFLVDKQGLLRFDNVRAGDKYHAKGDTTSFEDKISTLLSEPVKGE